MKNKGLSEHSIKNVSKALRLIEKESNLQEPEQIKAYIANKNTSNGYKHNHRSEKRLGELVILCGFYWFPK
jgi:hypothetical protein